jgi:hypothetical protein
MERARRRIGMVGAVSLTAVLALGACSDESTSASDQVCDARSELRDSVDAVTSNISDGNFEQARDALPDVRDSYDNLVSAMDDLSDEERADLEPSVDALRESIEGLPESESIEDLGSQLETITSDLQGIIDSITDSLQCS